ncbi:MAG: AAA family ATPase [Xenococcaceae cyanobacterium]
MNNVLIIISGLPCTGKTTLARKIARQFSIPLISKDDLKESLFDSLGWQDRNWSRKLGIASYNLLDRLIESQVSFGRSLIVESNFMPQFSTQKFLNLKQKYALRIIQIYCQAEAIVLFERFKQRVELGERHPGHQDHLNYQEFKKNLKSNEYETLNLGDLIIKIDTKDWTKLDYNFLFKQINEEL